jgi:hypothetical protein
MPSRLFAIVVTLGFVLTAGVNASRQKTPITAFDVQLTTTAQKNQLHWKITNMSNTEIYIYSFFLYGPAYGTEDKTGSVIFDTLPPSLESGCPNRFPPVLLLRVPPGDYREGDFRDDALNTMSGRTVLLKIGGGSEPYSVVAEADRIRWKSRNCSKSPYDAIFEWATIQVSNPVQVP